MSLCVIWQLILLGTGKPVDIVYGNSMLMNSQEIQTYEDYDGCIMAFLGKFGAQPILIFFGHCLDALLPF